MKKLNKIQKIFLFAALACIAIDIIILILAIFDITHDVVWKIALCSLYVFAGCLYSANAISFTDKNKILAYVCLAFIWLSVIGGILATMATLGAVLNRIIGTFAIITAFLVVLIGTALKSGGKFKLLSYILWILCIAIDIVLTIQVWGGHLFKINLFGQVFSSACIIAGGLLIAINILNRKTIEDANKVSITKEEYEMLKEKARLYDEITNK